MLNRTASIAAAIPLAFAVTLAAGVAMERLMIRRSCDRPLDILPATFGIPIALRQFARNTFGTKVRTRPDTGISGAATGLLPR